MNPNQLITGHLYQYKDKNIVYLYETINGWKFEIDNEIKIIFKQQ